MIAQEEDGGSVLQEPGSRGRCEVAVQWERPEGQSQEVGVQSQTQRSDVAVQVDLIGLSFAKPGSCDVPWRCVSVRAEQPEGGALWTCCLHSPSAPSALLCPSTSDPTTQTSTKELQTTRPRVHQSSPSLNQPSLPSMPICGDSPSSSNLNTTDPPDPPDANATDPPDANTTDPPDAPHDPSDLPDPSDPSPEASLEALGFMAPLSSDEDDMALSEHDELISEAEPPTKHRRGRPKTGAKAFSPPESSTRRRNGNARQAGLPLRYQLDYDLESHDRTAAYQEPESGEGAGPGRDRKKKVLFLPYYEKSLDLGQLREFQNIARRQLEALREDVSQVDASIISRLMSRPLSPTAKQNKPRLLPLKLKKVKNKVDSCAAGSRKTRDWSIDDVAFKEERMDEERSDLARYDWSKRQKIKEENDKFASKKTPDWSERQRFAINQEGHWAKSKKEQIWLKQREKQRFVDVNVVKGKGRHRVKRKPGRPRKVVQLKQEEEFEVEAWTERDFVSEASSAEQSDRPRRKTVGPPIRYLQESEARSARKQRFQELLDPREDTDWFRDIKTEELEEGGHFTNGTAESLEDGSGVLRQGRLKLMDSSGDGEGGLVKKVKILGSDAEGERCGNGHDDVRSLSMIRGEEEWGDEENRGGGGGVCEDWKRRAGFLIYRDEETGRMEFIPPCYVKLQPLTGETVTHGHEDTTNVSTESLQLMEDLLC